MSGIFRLGTKGLVIGLMLAAAPTGAGALTTINVVSQNILFPESVVGDAAPSEGGSIVAFDQLFNFGISLRFPQGTTDGEETVDGAVAGDTPLDLDVDIAQSFVLERRQGAAESEGDSEGVVGTRPREVGPTDGNGVVGTRPREVASANGEAVVGTRPLEIANGGGLVEVRPLETTDGEDEEPPVGAAPRSIASGTSSPAVSTAPEPATWIMMICGFWLVAWRLRQGRQTRRKTELARA